jgi:hypothetical protein
MENIGYCEIISDLPEITPNNTVTTTGLEIGASNWWLSDSVLNCTTVTSSSLGNGPYTITGNTNVFPNSYVFGDILKITPDGFYVRGNKLEQDDSEAKLVFEAMKEFLNQNIN